MLDAAGVQFDVRPSNLDEAEIKVQLNTPDEIAGKLAIAKAEEVSARHPDKWVAGSDSVVSVVRRVFDKPGSREAAASKRNCARQRHRLAGKEAQMLRGGQADWSHVDSATLQVRDLSEEFIRTYLDAEWPDVGYCVGVFRLEGRGVQLFDRIEGDYFTILGMPLLPLLGALRNRRVLPS